MTLTRRTVDKVLPAFVKCLEHLPNLHTLQFLHVHSQMTTMLKTHFEGHTFPQVRTIILPSCAHNILRSCPELTSVTCNEDDGGKLIAPIGACCKKVETLVNIRPSAAIIKRQLVLSDFLSHALTLSSRAYQGGATAQGAGN